METPQLWYVIGFAGQALFASRFLVQWLTSERAGKSTVPVAFWYLSMGGGVTLLAYALFREDTVFFVGQLGGLFIYMRNLHLIIRERRAIIDN